MRRVHAEAQARVHAVHRVIRMNRQLSKAAHWALLVVGVALVLLSSEHTRHWIVEFAATICVVGGFIAAPILTITAWIGMMAPNLLLLHRLSTLLFIVAIVWLALAFIGAHLHHSHQQAQEPKD